MVDEPSLDLLLHRDFLLRGALLRLVLDAEDLAENLRDRQEAGADVAPDLERGRKRGRAVEGGGGGGGGEGGRLKEGKGGEKEGDGSTEALPTDPNPDSHTHIYTHTALARTFFASQTTV